MKFKKMRVRDLLAYTALASKVCIYAPVPGTVGEFEDVYDGFASNVPDELKKYRINIIYSGYDVAKLYIGLEEIDVNSKLNY